MNTRLDRYDHLYLSPHFDDVALSCGGGVFLQTASGESVLVVTIATAEPPDGPISATVQALHNRWRDSLAGEELEDTIVGRRRAEDRAAFAILGADILHLPFQDCIYRLGPAGEVCYPGPTDMFGPISATDADIIDELAATFAGLPPAKKVYGPLSVGGHVDHQATRRAAERVFPDLIYYEDYPYTMRPGALEEVLPRGLRGEWTAEIVRLTPAALAAKIEAVAAYKSQLSSFFTGYDDLALKLREEGQRVIAEAAGTEPHPEGGECLWRRLSRSFN